jgi:hypothetical protein
VTILSKRGSRNSKPQRSRLIAELAAGEQLPIESKDILSLYAAFQWLRVPDFQRGVDKVGAHMVRRTMDMMFRDEEDVKKSLEEFTRDTGQVIEKEPKDLLNLMRSENLEVEIKRSLSLEMMLKQADTFANMFRQMNWLVLHAWGECSFVTSDNPLVLAPPKDFPQKGVVWLWNRHSRLQKRFFLSPNRAAF